MTKLALPLAIGLLLPAATALAQSAPTCSFDGSSTLTVTVDGQTANLAVATTGAIRLNGNPCPGATTTTVDTIVVNGSALGDRLSLRGSFAPGLTPEVEGTSEIEFVIALGAGADITSIDLSEGPDLVAFTASGVDIGGDLDEDIPTAGIETVRIYGLGGDDTMDASDYAGGGRLYLDGGYGNDTLIGSAQDDSLYGEYGDDILMAGAGSDFLAGGYGNDAVHGEAGNDTLSSQADYDGDDSLSGGGDVDTLTYARRAFDMTVTIGNGLSDDGLNGLEHDAVDADVENVTTGSGNDVLVGNSARNRLIGGAGADEIYGGDGNDKLYGGDGADILVGDAGGDSLYGEAGFDSLDGGDGVDRLWGGIGKDTLTGGGGTDQLYGEDGNDVFFNDDGEADTVDCGAGLLDDPEPDPNDSFVGCELI